ENLSMDFTNTTTTNGVGIRGARDIWMKNVRSLTPNRAHVGIESATRFTIRDSYFYGTQNAVSQSYGIECNLCSDGLIENNIWQQISLPIPLGKQASGVVADYNYAVNDFYNGTSWMQAGLYHHASGMNYILFEGNIGPGVTADAIHGTQAFQTAYRNFLKGQ